MLKISALSKSYGKKLVLKGVDATFESGHIHGIIGSNGAGKSTLFRCICGLERYQGKITYSVSKQPIKNHIAYLPTNSYFYPKLTGKEYLEFYAKFLKNQPTIGYESLNKIFGLPLNMYIENYSTGMRKKIAFLASLLLDRPIYILDEPFNGLDLDAVLLFKEIIMELKQKKVTIIVSSHIIGALTDSCDTILHLHEGQFKKRYNKDNYDSIEKDITKDINRDVTEFFKEK